MNGCLFLAVLVCLAAASIPLYATRPWENTRDVSAIVGKKCMRAWQYAKHGTPQKQLALNECAPLPVMRESEVLVKVHAAALNPVDHKMMKGYIAFAEPLLYMFLPLVPGFDLAGTVVAVGSAVKHFKKGDKVLGQAPFYRRGSCAEYIAIDPSRLGIKADSLSFSEAASLPLATLTSYLGLYDIAHVQKGHKVLILGGSGGTGTMGIQLAKARGAYVATTCSARNTQLVKDLGANRVIDYKTKHWWEELQGGDYDVVYDCVGGDSSYLKSANILKQGGMFVTIVGDSPRGGAIGFLAKVVTTVQRSVKGVLGLAPRYSLYTSFGDGRPLAHVKELVEQRKLKPVVDTVYAFGEAKEAFAHLMTQRARGKIVLCVHDCEAK